MTTVCIIGAGELGGSIAHALARGERVSRVVILDELPGRAEGKALDIQQSGAVERFHTRVLGSTDLTRAAGTAVCIVADRAGQAPSEWAGEEGLMMLTRMLPALGDAPLVFAGTAQAELLLAASREAGIPRARLIGSAPSAYASAVTAIVAMEARCSPVEVRLTVLGAPPHGLVVPWSEASIGGYALDRVLTQVQLVRIEARAARLWPPGPFALGASAARVAEAVVGSSRRTFAILSVLDGELGVRGRTGILPVRLSRTGIVHRQVPTLNTRERVQVETALGA